MVSITIRKLRVGARSSALLRSGCFPFALAFVIGLIAQGAAQAQVSGPICAHYDEDRQPFFGDVHVHTRLSFDAAGFDVRTGPRDAYRFARGEAIDLPPYDAMGDATRTHQLRSPLDFAAVTDHAELLGETSLCTTNPLSDPACVGFANLNPGSVFSTFGPAIFETSPSRHPLCGPGGVFCTSQAQSVWDVIRSAADEFEDPDGDCGFSSLIAYEWTAAPLRSMHHRNVIFRGGATPALPLSYVEASSVESLWNGLRDQCALVGAGCEFLTIPHNTNFSRGESLPLFDLGDLGAAAHFAALSEYTEPLAELSQHKGDSECEFGLGSSDPECDFGKVDLGASFGGYPRSFIRNGLKEGLVLEQSLGTNPHRYGLTSSTDSHNSMPGATEEDNYPGHSGIGDDTPEKRLNSTWAQFSPGGLIVLWAEENTRDSLFEAMRRREAYSTSGTRPTVRFFGGPDLAPGLCSAGNLVSQGYADGVPMGGRIEATPSSGSPRFVVMANQDPGTTGFPGTPLSEIQVIKGWVDSQGITHESVTSISGTAPSPLAVDPATCQTDGSGFATLCAEWEDPAFDPTEHAFYYVRVLESPTCRWSQRLCLDAGVDCALEVPAGFEACCSGSVPETIQERAISSPIWVRPVPEPNFLVGLWIGGVVLLTKRRTALIRPVGSVARTEGFGPRTPSSICCQEPD